MVPTTCAVVYSVQRRVGGHFSLSYCGCHLTTLSHPGSYCFNEFSHGVSVRHLNLPTPEPQSRLGVVTTCENIMRGIHLYYMVYEGLQEGV
jgi:hypothetical protein